MSSISAGKASEIVSGLRRIASNVDGALAVDHGGGTLATRLEGLTRELDDSLGLARARMSEIDSRIEQLRARVKDLDGVDDAVEGVSLLKNSEEAVAALRERNNYWSDGFLGAEGDLIEQQIRSGPVAAEAARLLGYPVGVAHIPTPDGPVSAYIVPTKIVSPVAGFPSFDDARQAANQYLSESPRSTMVILYDGVSVPDRNHLLAANLDTSPRTVTSSVNGKLGKKKTSTRVEGVEIQKTTSDHWWIIQSDNSLANTDSKQLADWPEGRSTPFGHDNVLSGRGLVARHKSERTNALEALDDLDEERFNLKAAADEVIQVRSHLMENRWLLNKLDNLPDHPGEAGMAEWEAGGLGEALHGESLSVEFNITNMAAHIAMPGSTVAEATLQASKMNADKLIAVMQDSSGTPHITFTNVGTNLDLTNFLDRGHPDMRAIINPKTDEVFQIRDQVATRIGTRITSGRVRQRQMEDQRIYDWVSEHVVGRPAKPGVEGVGKIEMSNWNDDEPAFILKADNLSDALIEAKSMISPNSPVPTYVLSLPPFPNKFVLINTNQSHAWGYRDNFHPFIRAVIQRGKVMEPVRT